MLELDRAGIQRWIKMQTHRVRREILKQNETETWPVDRNGGVEAEIVMLGAALERAAGVSGYDGAAPVDDPLENAEILRQFQLILSNISPPRRFRLLSWLSETGWGHGGADLLSGKTADSGVDVNVIKTSLAHIHSCGLLGELFSADNLAPILAALEE